MLELSNLDCYGRGATLSGYSPLQTLSGITEIEDCRALCALERKCEGFTWTTDGTCTLYAVYYSRSSSSGTYCGAKQCDEKRTAMSTYYSFRILRERHNKLKNFVHRRARF